VGSREIGRGGHVKGPAKKIFRRYNGRQRRDNRRMVPERKNKKNFMRGNRDHWGAGYYAKTGNSR